MSPQRRTRWLAAAVLLPLLAACGQKGPLYLPDPAPQPVPEAGTVPDGSTPASPADSDNSQPDPARKKAASPPDPGH